MLIFKASTAPHQDSCMVPQARKRVDNRIMRGISCSHQRILVIYQNDQALLYDLAAKSVRAYLSRGAMLYIIYAFHAFN